MEVIPAVDIRGGCCVRLYQGDYDRETVFSEDPAGMARHWERLGAPRLHVVDLDGAPGGYVLANGLHQAALAQVTHGVGGGAHARHDEDAGGGRVLRPAADERLEAGAGHGPLHAAQVPRTVIDDHDSHGVILTSPLL